MALVHLYNTVNTSLCLFATTMVFDNYTIYRKIKKVFKFEHILSFLKKNPDLLWLGSVILDYYVIPVLHSVSINKTICKKFCGTHMGAC
jgi:hypothetical protein